jgi:hypothetical protein
MIRSPTPSEHARLMLKRCCVIQGQPWWDAGLYRTFMEEPDGPGGLVSDLRFPFRLPLQMRTGLRSNEGVGLRRLFNLQRFL